MMNKKQLKWETDLLQSEPITEDCNEGWTNFGEETVANGVNLRFVGVLQSRMEFECV